MLGRQGGARVLGVTVAVLVALMATAAGVQAKEGFFVGGGLVDQSAGGDEELDSGRGLALKVGYGFNRAFALEYLTLGSDHTFRDNDTGLTGDATLNGSTIALRATTRLAGRLDGFLRLGNSSLFGGYSLEVENDAGLSLDWDGNGSSFGAGVEWFIGSGTGIEISYLRHELALERDTLFGTDEMNLSVDSFLVMIGVYF